MARARNIKPGFFVNEELVGLPFSTRLLFIGLWTVADRAGRLEDRPKRIKMAVFPADNVDIDGALDDLESSGFLLRYKNGDARYIQILAFDKHQHPHKDEKQSAIPAPALSGAGTGQEPWSHNANPADSPIPDSLIPDSPNPQQDHRQRQDIEVGARAVTPADLSVVMRTAGIPAQPADPRLIALASQGITPETVAAACGEAKRSKPNESIGVGYVLKILERWAREKASMNVAGAVQPRASPFRYESEKERAQRETIEGLTGRRQHEQRSEFIYITSAARPIALG
ncbi:hypothetical protein ABC383_22865 [Noviherbaspirillum sp. 1P10PC]|uniref:hypothetical protein n=1 Tax=Noviherbaspirillum sp. 1P10PC TaxID=3132292 RepID=UPI00399F54CF